MDPPYHSRVYCCVYASLLHEAYLWPYWNLHIMHGSETLLFHLLFLHPNHSSGCMQVLKPTNEEVDSIEATAGSHVGKAAAEEMHIIGCKHCYWMLSCQEASSQSTDEASRCTQVCRHRCAGAHFSVQREVYAQMLVPMGLFNWQQFY